MGKSLARYSLEQLETVKASAGELLASFGYDVCCDGERRVVLSPIDLSRLRTDSDLAEGGGEERRAEEEGPWVVNCPNSPLELRTPEDQFGRRITFLRKGLTSNDTHPFDTL